MHDEIAVETARRVLAPLAVGDVQTDVGALHVTVPVAKGAASLTDALARLAGEGVGVRDAGLRRPTLDDVFLTLTGHEALATGDDGEAALTKEYSK